MYIIAFYVLLGCVVPLSFAGEKDKIFWDKKYETESYIFGKEPVEFLREHIDLLPRGKALDIAMGEGRNAVFLAKNGFDVDCCDISESAIKKPWIWQQRIMLRYMPLSQIWRLTNYRRIPMM